MTASKGGVEITAYLNASGCAISSTIAKSSWSFSYWEKTPLILLTLLWLLTVVTTECLSYRDILAHRSNSYVTPSEASLLRRHSRAEF